MSARTLAVVSAGLRQPSSTRLLADRLAEATVSALREQEVDVDVQVVELRDHAHDLTNHLLTGFPASALRDAIDTVVTADGVIAVSPIFNASYSGLFKSFFDVIEADALAGTPVLMGATGGTERHSLALEHALRPLFIYLRCLVVPTSVYAATSDWGVEGGDPADGLGSRIRRGGRELAEIVASRRTDGPADPFGDPTPFEQLLAGD